MMMMMMMMTPGLLLFPASSFLHVAPRLRRRDDSSAMTFDERTFQTYSKADEGIFRNGE